MPSTPVPLICCACLLSSLHCSLVDVDDPQRGLAEGVGFLFDSERPSDAIAALARAIKRVVREPQAVSLGLC